MRTRLSTLKLVCKAALVAPFMALPVLADGDQTERQHGASIVSPAAGSKISLEIGRGRLIRLDRPATEIFVADPTVADIQVKSPRVVYVFGKNRGETSLFALDSEDRTIYSAQIETTQNLETLNVALKRMLPKYRVATAILGNSLILEGTVSSPEEAALAENLATSFGSGSLTILNRIGVVQPTQVNLRVRIAEVSRSAMKQFGVNWESLFGTDFLFGIAQGADYVSTIADPVTGLPVQSFAFPQSGTRTIFNYDAHGIDLNFAIDALDQNGFLRVLAEPNLTAQSGQQASFLAGGEFPIPVPSSTGGAFGIQFRQFGVSLAFTPTVLDSGRINITVAPEVSELSTAGAIDINGISVPAISSRRAQTTVELGSGQSFAIAGLLQNRTTQDATKYPGLGDIPILGALFKSDDFRRSETELLIVVTPYLVEPVSDRQIVLPTDGFEAKGDLDRITSGQAYVAKPGDKAAPMDQQTGVSRKERAGFQIN